MKPANDAPMPLAGSPAPDSQILSPLDLAEKADVTIYPGAEVPNGKSNLRTDGGKTRYEMVMDSPDAVDKILGFYEKKFQSAERMPGKDNVMGMTPKGHFASVQTTREGSKTHIDVVVTDEK